MALSALSLASFAFLPVGAGALATGWGAPAASASAPAVIDAIGAENEYADVLSQIGGNYVHVSSILNNPNTDPHTFEASPSVAQEVSAAELIVQNGVGYDTFMNRIESASPNSARKVIVVQHLLGLPDNTPNPHLWYSPTTMPKVAKAMAAEPVGAPAVPRRLLRGQRWRSSTRRCTRGWPPSARSRRSTAGRRPPRRSPSPTTC